MTESTRIYTTTEEYLVKRIADLEYENKLIQESTEELHNSFEAMQNASSFSMLKRKISDSLTAEDAISSIASTAKYIQKRTGDCLTQYVEDTVENCEVLRACMKTNQQDIIQIQQLLYCLLSLYSENDED